MSFEGLGTHWHIGYDADVLDNSILQIMNTFELRYSRFLPDSLVSQLNTEKELIVDGEFLSFFREGINYHVLTGGLFSPFVGAALNALGYDPHYSFTVKDSLAQLEEKFIVDGNNIRLGKYTSFDAGGYGKGYMIDMIADFFGEQGIENWIINGGGDIRFQFLDEQYRQGLSISHAVDRDILLAEWNNPKGALATSSHRLRRWGNNHHLISPQTAKPAKITMHAISVFAETACLADVASTTLYVGGLERLEELSQSLGVGYLMLGMDDNVVYSSGISGLTVFAR